MDKEILKELREVLQYGDNQEVARVTGLSTSTVSNHLNGYVKHPSKLIIDAAMQIIAERQRQDRRTAKKIKSLTSA